MADKTYSEEEMAAMRAAVAADDAKRVAEAQARRAAYLAPLSEIVSAPEYQSVMDRLTALRAQYVDDGGHLSIHVNALTEIMPRLRSAAGVASPTS